MIFGKKFFLILFFLVLSLGLILYSHFDISRKIKMKVLGLQTTTPDTRQPQKININGTTKIKYPQDYTVVMLGDSMTERLGNSDELMSYLKKDYPNKSFQILNYGFGATNILSAQERLERETFRARKFSPILDIAFDLILIESFGHNPLSQFPLAEGLKRQTEALDKIIDSIKKSNSSAKIVFVATIAPNKKQYAVNQVNLASDEREKWAEERIAYIKNHINYANSHQIPVINIFEKSLTSNQDSNLEYISKDDYIHPSPNGVYFISEQIAKFIFENLILSP